jgi:hypothetical protein
VIGFIVNLNCFDRLIALDNSEVGQILNLTVYPGAYVAKTDADRYATNHKAKLYESPDRSQETTAVFLSGC